MYDDPMARAAIQAAKRATEDHSSWEQGFIRGWRVGSEETGAIAYATGRMDGWNAHRARAKKARKQLAAELRAELDAKWFDGYDCGIRDNADVVLKLKQQLSELNRQEN